MKSIVINIDCGEEHCVNCDCVIRDEEVCTLFNSPLDIDPREKDFFRCTQCLETEAVYERLVE